MRARKTSVPPIGRAERKSLTLYCHASANKPRRRNSAAALLIAARPLVFFPARLWINIDRALKTDICISTVIFLKEGKINTRGSLFYGRVTPQWDRRESIACTRRNVPFRVRSPRRARWESSRFPRARYSQLEESPCVIRGSSMRDVRVFLRRHGAVGLEIPSWKAALSGNLEERRRFWKEHYRAPNYWYRRLSRRHPRREAAWVRVALMTSCKLWKTWAPLNEERFFQSFNWPFN